MPSYSFRCFSKKQSIYISISRECAQRIRMIGDRDCDIVTGVLYRRQNSEQGITPMMDILDPTIATARERIDYTPRPKNLKGLRVGLIDNTRKNSEAVLQARRQAQPRGIRMEVLVQSTSARRSKTIRSRISKAGPTSSLLESATEGRARRAVCSTPLSWKRPAFRRFRSSPMPLMPRPGRWQNFGACRISDT